MHNMYANFVKILGACKHFAQESVNEWTNRRIDEQIQSAGNDAPPLSDVSTNPSVPSNPFHFPFSLTTPL